MKRRFTYPFLDKIVIHVIEASQPRWLKFRVGDLDFTTVPAEFHDAVFTKDLQLRPAFQNQGIGLHKGSTAGLYLPWIQHE